MSAKEELDTVLKSCMQLGGWRTGVNCHCVHMQVTGGVA